MSQESDQAAAVAAEMHNCNRLIEAANELYGKLVSFDDELIDCHGEKWSKINSGGCHVGASALAYETEAELDKIRNTTRYLATENEFALNAHENRISYIVGSGHIYTVTAKPDMEVDPALIDQVNTVINDFIRLNQWQRRQQEIVRRRDRDGEAFLRFFPDAEGALRVRFVEPERIRNRQDEKDDNAKFGIIFAPVDAETAVKYIVHKSADDPDPAVVDAKHIQHRKANVDTTSPRGLPLLYPVRKNLARAEKLLTNMGHLAGIRSAIAMIRKHVQGSAAKIQDYASGMADIQTTNSTTGVVRDYKRYAPGTILDAPNSVDYDFPTHQTDIASFVVALQAELRAIASRLVMAEFMLSSDASNANYASTMVAEGPTVKMFEREQADMILDDLDVIRMAIGTAAAAGKVDENVLKLVDIDVEAPQVRTRDNLAESQSDAILSTARVLSRQTMAARHGLNYETEQANMDAEDEQGDVIPGGGLDLGDDSGDDDE